MLCDFLRFVVEKTLSGSAQEIKGYTVATEVMGRKADFDAGKDTIVRIQGGRLRRALERYYLTIGGQDLIRIDIPKGAHVPTFHLAAREESVAEVSKAALDDTVLTLPSGPSVAVLPFLNLTGDRKQEFFCRWPGRRNNQRTGPLPGFAGNRLLIHPPLERRKA